MLLCAIALELWVLWPISTITAPRPFARATTTTALELAIVVPTYNEAENILVLASRLHRILDGRCAWEMIVVDDNSADGTADLVDNAAQAGDTIRCIRRIGRRGLSSAVIEGCLATFAPLVIVMDADLQHDEAILPDMLEKLRGPACDLVVGTRYAAGGSTGDWNKARKASSSIATWVARLATPTPISDPMSGFFGVRRDAFLEAAPHLSGAGFKVLLDIAASSPTPLRVAEVPYTFRLRTAGESKLSASVVFDYVGMIIEKRTNGWVPARFMLFVATGGLGVAVHMAVLFLLDQAMQLSFNLSQDIALFCAMTFNFILNNWVTYGDKPLRGRAAVFGLIRFYLVCGLGSLANISVADLVFQGGSGWFFSGLAGAFLAAVFNFVMTSRYVWGARG